MVPISHVITVAPRHPKPGCAATRPRAARPSPISGRAARAESSGVALFEVAGRGSPRAERGRARSQKPPPVVAGPSSRFHPAPATPTVPPGHPASAGLQEAPPDHPPSLNSRPSPARPGPTRRYRQTGCGHRTTATRLVPAPLRWGAVPARRSRRRPQLQSPRAAPGRSRTVAPPRSDAIRRTFLPTQHAGPLQASAETEYHLLGWRLLGGSAQEGTPIALHPWGSPPEEASRAWIATGEPHS